MTSILNKSSIRIGLLGAGRWGGNLARVIDGAKSAHLAAVCDIRPEAAAFIAAPILPMAQILDDAAIDAVAIATPSHLHFEHVCHALDAGKHVFVEKPMALSLDHATAMAALAESRGLMLMIGHVYLYNGAVRDIRRRIASGELGAIARIFSLRMNANGNCGDMDVLWALAPHDISIINYWLDDGPLKVSAHGHLNMETGLQDTCRAELDYGSGRIARLNLSRRSLQKRRQMVVVGSRRTLVYDDMTPNRPIRIFEHRSGGAFEGVSPEAVDDFLARAAHELPVEAVAVNEPLQAEIQEFVDCLIEDRTPLSDGRHGVGTVSVLESLARSARQSGGSVFCRNTDDVRHLDTAS